jgi:hypothetical protein
VWFVIVLTIGALLGVEGVLELPEAGWKGGMSVRNPLLMGVEASSLSSMVFFC